MWRFCCYRHSTSFSVFIISITSVVADGAQLVKSISAFCARLYQNNSFVYTDNHEQDVARHRVAVSDLSAEFSGHERGWRGRPPVNHRATRLFVVVGRGVGVDIAVFYLTDD